LRARCWPRSRGGLQFLADVGLDYLTLDRLSSTLSGGESQRINLATSLGSALVDTLYVLDEPSIGLHPRDNLRLITILRQLRDQGNTVVVVEHDADMIASPTTSSTWGLARASRAAASCSKAPRGLKREPRSLTAKYLREELSIAVPATRRRGTGQRLRITGAASNNLKHVDVAFPLGTLTAITGVSGSGKSTLVHDIIYAGVKRAKGESTGERKLGTFTSIEGTEFISDTVLVDQTPIGRTPRSNPVTYLKAFDPIRELFASTKTRAAGASRPATSPSTCRRPVRGVRGEGQVRVEMQFLADVFVPCDQCDGKRFKPQVLEVKYRGRNIHQVLDLTVREALAFFSTSPKVLRRLQVLDEIGLGYLRLGQPATTLSGGERSGSRSRRTWQATGGERLALRARRADHGPALRRHREAARRVPQAARAGALAAGHRAQHGRHQDGGLRHRPGARGRRGRRHGGCDGHARADRGECRVAHRDGFFRRCWLRAARMPMREVKMSKRALVGLAVLGWLAAAPLAAQTGSDALIDALKNPSTRTRIDALHSLGDACTRRSGRARWLRCSSTATMTSSLPRSSRCSRSTSCAPTWLSGRGASPPSAAPARCRSWRSRPARSRRSRRRCPAKSSSISAR
jgi:ABC-type Mn2+/Zn2+ transport system ATPase subunit